MKVALARRTMDSWTYRLTMHAGHLLIEAAGRRYLIDTGSPVSLSDAPIRLAMREFPVEPSMLGMSSIASIVEMVGTPFDALIGTDILGEFDIEISLYDRTLTLYDTLIDLSAGSPVEFLAGVPLIACQIAGRSVHCFLDTGAPLSYLGGNWLDAALALGEIEDFHPLFGRFRVETYATLIHCLGNEVKLRIGRMPGLLEATLLMAGSDGILGTDLFEHGILRLSHRQKRSALVRFYRGVNEMSNAGVKMMREPVGRKRADDAPQRLRELTDIAKGKAIAAGFERVVGHAFTATVEAVRYHALDRQREFQCPAEIRLTVTPVNGDDCGCVKGVADSELESAIADSLAMAAGEDYRVRIVNKDYEWQRASVGSVRLTLQVGIGLGGMKK